MENPAIKEEVRRSIKHWYLPLLLGIVFIAVGIWVFMTPVASFLTLAMLFAVTFLVTGFIEAISAIYNRNQLDGWGWQLTVGVIDLLIGLLLVLRPDITIVILPFYVGFDVMFRSISSIGWAFDLRRYGAPDWGLLLILGILGLVFSFVLLWNPILAGLTVVVYTALAFLSVGVFQIYLAFALRKLRDLVA